MRVNGNGCYDNPVPQRNQSQYQVRQSPAYGQQTNVKTEGSAPASVSDEKKFRRISDKSQDHQRFFKNLIELPNNSVPTPSKPQGMADKIGANQTLTNNRPGALQNTYGQAQQILNRGNMHRTSVFNKNASSENNLGGNNTYQGPQPVAGMEQSYFA